MKREEPASFNPFPGLRSFEPDEDHLFFGRDVQVDELLARLGRTRFLAVVGTSGSGKSSLVRSGLIPSLYSGYMTKAGSSWRVAIFRPGEDPIGNLGAALNHESVLGGGDLPSGPPGGGAVDPEVNRQLIEATLRRSARGLAECVRQARLPEHDSVLVLADQFEELFRFKSNRRIRDSRESALAFVKLLLEGAGAADTPVYVVLTMRSDFIGNCTEFPGLVEAINEGQYLVPRMSREERRQAIAGPVAVGGAEIAPRLVTRLLNDVGDDPDQLPILQHSLMRAWSYWDTHRVDGEPLDLRHYEAIGTLQEALSLHAEEAYRELEDRRARVICEQLFKGLTERGTDSRGVRRPLRFDDAMELTGASAEELAAVVERFRQPGRTFLMPAWPAPLGPDSILDISHESLMRTWKRLIQWVDEEARSAQVYLRLSRAAGLYHEGKSALWRDPELQLAVNWRDEAKPTSIWAQRYDPAFERALLFLEYSEKERALENAEKERQRRRQLRRARLLAAFFGAATLIFLLMGLVMMNLVVKAEDARVKESEARGEAERNAAAKVEQAKIAEQQRLEAVAAREEAEEQRSLAEENEAVANEQRRRAEGQEREAMRRKEEAEVQRLLADKARGEALDERAQAIDARERALRSESEARRLREVALARALAVQTTRIDADHAELAALLALAAYRLNADNDGDPEDPNIYNALRTSLNQLDPDRRRIYRVTADAVRGVAVAPDGRTVAVASDDGTLGLLDLERPGAGATKLAELAGVPLRAVAVDGQQLAAGSFDGAIRLWDLARREAPPQRLAGHDAGVNALAFQAGGGRLASAGSDGTVRLWDLARPQAPVEVGKAPGKASAVAVSPDGKLLAAGTAGGLLLWDVGRLSGEPTVLAADQPAGAVAFSRDGGLLAAGTENGAVALWDLTDRSRPRQGGALLGHGSPVSGLSFASAGRLASASLDGTVRLWNVSRPEAEPIVLADHQGWVWTVTFNPRGDELVSGGADRTVRVWTTRTAELAGEICGAVTRNPTRAEWTEYLGADVEYVKICPKLPDPP